MPDENEPAPAAGPSPTTDDARSAVVDVAPEIVIRRERNVVAAFMFNPLHDAEWTRNVMHVRLLTGPTVQPGTRVHRVVRFMGRLFGYTYEVVEVRPNRALEMVVDQPFPMRIRYELEDTPDGTLARIRAQGDPGGFFRVAAPLLKIAVCRGILQDLSALKARLESA